MKTLLLRIPEPIYDELKIQAKKNYRSVNAEICHRIKYLNTHFPPDEND